MATDRVWVVRAGRGSEIIEEIEDKGVLALGFRELGDCTGLRTRDEFRERLREQRPDLSGPRTGVHAGQLFRFYHEMAEGDTTLTPDKNAREILVGEVAGPAEFRPEVVSDGYPNVRRVKWLGRFSRDAMSEKFKASTGSIATVFTVQGFSAEIERLLAGEGAPEATSEEAEDEPYDFAEETKAKADDLIADMLAKIAWDDFERLVTGVLRAMGFRATLTSAGADGGSDIIAHPDALGFEEPRIRAEVKHRKGSVGAPEVRSFRAALGPTEKGLYISTGGFTSDARREPATAGPPLTLMDRDAFLDLLTENYEALEPEFQAMVPLKKVYIPLRVE